jgi:alpha-beta hydrolase superfamily lysophospholipase
MIPMPSPCVLDEDDALELLAFLVTAARTQVDEAAEYGPMRLLTAAHRLGELIAARASAESSAAVTTALAEMPPLAVPRDDRADYVARLDDLCRAVAAHLVSHFGVAHVDASADTPA